MEGDLMNLRHLWGWGIIGFCWWMCAFTYGFFQVIMWSLILTACIGIYIQLSGKKT